VGFSFAAWWNLGIMQTKLKGATPSASPANITSQKTNQKLASTRRRLLQISLQTSVCLLLNMGATVSLSASLTAWSETSDLWIGCTFEGPFSRGFSAYGFTQESREVCTAATATWLRSDINTTSCAGACSWIPKVAPITLGNVSLDNYLVCATTSAGSDNLEALIDHIGSETTDRRLWSPCDCDCRDFVEVEEPSYLAMLLSHVAQVLHHVDPPCDCIRCPLILTHFIKRLSPLPTYKTTTNYRTWSSLSWA
jgi:hypothetical protein